MDAYVLDTFALMAHFQGEPRGSAVKALLAQALDERVALSVSLISAGELFYMTWRKRDADRAKSVWADLQRLPISVVPVNEARVLSAARLKATHRVSYADAFSIALAQELDGTVITGDPEFKNVESLVPVMWLT
jgi:predicted nucleic acid-binding protein